MERYGRIEVNPYVMFGKPVIKNTRIPVEQVRGKLSAGMTADEIVQEHPRLRIEDVLAVEA